MTNTRDRLYRSQTDKVLGGVCGGLGYHYGLDPIIIRILWALAVFTPAAALTILSYILCWLLIPREPAGWRTDAATIEPSQRGALVGTALVIIGIVALLAVTTAISLPVLLAVAMIVVGAMIALGAFPNGFSHRKEG